MAEIPISVLAERYIPCSVCDSKPGESCERKNSSISYNGNYTHASRMKPFLEQYRSGYRAGYANGCYDILLDTIEEDSE